MRCPRRLWLWIDRRGRIPGWVWWLWPFAHWCPEMDDLLLVDAWDVEHNCFCEVHDRAGYPPWGDNPKPKVLPDEELF